MARLERLLYDTGDNADDDDDVFLVNCVRIGILVFVGRERHDELAFSSPVVWRYLVKNRVNSVPRAADNDAPTSVSQLMHRCQQAMVLVRVTRRTAEETRPSQRLRWSAVASEQAWQLAFYKAVHRVTPRSYRTSIDDRGLFGSSGFVDIVVRHGDVAWGMERVGRDNARPWRGDHVAARFAPDGEYTGLGLSDVCFVDLDRMGTDVVDAMPRDGDGNATVDDSTHKLYVVHCDEHGHERSVAPVTLDGAATREE